MKAAMSRVESQHVAEGAEEGADREAAGARVSAEALFARLDALGIAHRTVRHPQVFPVEESRALRGTLPGGHVKNLFMPAKKKRSWPVTAMGGRGVDLKDPKPPPGASGSR